MKCVFLICKHERGAFWGWMDIVISVWWCGVCTQCRLASLSKAEGELVRHFWCRRHIEKLGTALGFYWTFQADELKMLESGFIFKCSDLMNMNNEPVSVHHRLQAAAVQGWHALLVCECVCVRIKLDMRSVSVNLCVFDLWPFPSQSTCCQRPSRGWQPPPPGSSTNSPGSASCKSWPVHECVSDIFLSIHWLLEKYLSWIHICMLHAPTLTMVRCLLCLLLLPWRQKGLPRPKKSDLGALFTEYEYIKSVMIR